MRKVANPDLMLADGRLSLLEGVIIPWGSPIGFLRKRVIEPLARKHGVHPNAAWDDLPEAMRNQILNGCDEISWEGAVGRLERRYYETTSEKLHARLAEFMSNAVCGDCGGSRLGRRRWR